MAAETSFGTGKDYATANTAVANTDAGGTCTGWARTTGGSRRYKENITISGKVITLVTEAKGKKIRVQGTLTTTGSYAGTTTVTDFIFRLFGASYKSVNIAHSGGATTIFESCMFQDVQGVTGTTRNTTYRNCIFLDSIYGFDGGKSGGTVKFDHILWYNCSSNIFYKYAGVTYEVNNCIVANCGGLIGGSGAATLTGDYNRTDAASGLPNDGAHSAFSQTMAQLSLAFYISENMPDDVRPVVSGGSNLAGASIRPGITRGFSGESRDLANHDIGPSQQLVGFYATATAPPDKCTGVTMAALAGGLSVNFTLPSQANMGGLLVNKLSADLLSNIGASAFSMIVANLTALTSYSNIRLSEIPLPKGTDLENGQEYSYQVIPGQDNVFKTAGYTGSDVKKGTPESDVPDASTITDYTEGDTEVVISVTGDAGVTNEFWYKPQGGSWTQGLDRNGDGDITQTGLANGTIYEGQIRPRSVGGEYGPSSNTIYFIPTGGAAASPIAAYRTAFRDLYLNNTFLLAWIQSVNAGQTTAGHVFLGYRPQNITQAWMTINGPVALIRSENLRLENAGGPKTLRGTIDLVADHIWRMGTHARVADEFTTEIGYLDRILNEMIGDIGIKLHATYGGHLVSIDSPQVLEMDLQDETIVHSEIRYRIGLGRAGN